MAEVEPYTFKAAQELVDDAVRRSETRHRRWRALEQLFRIGNTQGLLTARDIPSEVWEEWPSLTLDTVNLALPHMSIIIASAVERSPEFVVEPYGASDADGYVAEETLRYYWKRLKGTQLARAMTQDMVILGNGFAKSGWVYREEEIDRPEEDVAAELAELLHWEENEAELEQREARSEEELAELIEDTETVVVEDEPWVEYVSPYDIFVPASGRRLEDLRWVAHRMIVPIDEVKANPLYKNTDTLYPTEEEDRGSRDTVDEDDAVHEQLGTGDETDAFTEVTLYEFYDLRARQLLVFQKDGGALLYEGPWPYTHRHSPFVHMRNHEHGGNRFWAFGDLENLAAILHQLNEMVERQMDNADRSGTKTAVSDQVWSPEMQQALESSQPDIAFPVKMPAGQPITDVIHPIPRQSLPADVYAAKEDLERYAATTIGLNDFQLGGTGSDRMSATAAAVADGTATLRSSDKRWQVETAIGHMGLLILLLCQEYLTEEVSFLVTKDDGVREWLTVDPGDLVGEYDCSVETGSTQAVNPATRQQRAVETMTAIIPALAAEGYDTHPLWRRALKDYGYNPDRLLRKKPELEAMSQQIALQLLAEGGGPAGAVTPNAAPAQAPSGQEPAQRADVASPGEVAT